MKGPRQLFLDVKLDDSVSLDNFILCNSTELAIKSLQNFISEDSLINFLFLWGKKGTGKKYLLQAANKSCIDKEKKTGFLSLADIEQRRPEILEGLEMLDVVFIEDIHLIPNTDAWLQAFFHFINTCLLKGTKLFFSSDLVAKDIVINLADLKSRLMLFTPVEIPEITEEEKRSALIQSAKRRGLTLEEKTISYILTHTSRSLSDLLRLLADLDNFSLEKQRKLTIPLVKELIANRSNSPYK